MDKITHSNGKVYLRTGECDGCRREGATNCCTYLSLPLARMLSEDEQHWVSLHPGLSIEGQSVHINISCSALEDGNCTLFGKPERPEMCVRYPEMPEQLIPGCAYQLVEVA